MHAGFGGLHRIMLIMDRGGWAGQVIDLVGFDIERKGDVVPNDFKTMVIEHTLDVATRAREIIIHAEDIRALLEQTLAKVGAEKSGRLLRCGWIACAIPTSRRSVKRWRGDRRDV
jgi:hypothetical protein